MAGHADEEIAPLFDDAPPNCHLPGLWLHRRDPAMARLIDSLPWHNRTRQFLKITVFVKCKDKKINIYQIWL